MKHDRRGAERESFKRADDRRPLRPFSLHGGAARADRSGDLGERPRAAAQARRRRGAGVDRPDMAGAVRRRPALRAARHQSCATPRRAAPPTAEEPVALAGRRRPRHDRRPRGPPARHQPGVPPTARDRMPFRDLPERRRGLPGHAGRHRESANQHRHHQLHLAHRRERHALHRGAGGGQGARRRRARDHRWHRRQLGAVPGLSRAATKGRAGRPFPALAAALAHASGQPALAQEDPGDRRHGRLHRRHEHRRRERHAEPPPRRRFRTRISRSRGRWWRSSSMPSPTIGPSS